MNLKKNHTSAFANRKVKRKVLICWGGIVIKMYYSLLSMYYESLRTNKQHVSLEYCCRGSWDFFYSKSRKLVSISTFGLFSSVLWSQAGAV